MFGDKFDPIKKQYKFNDMPQQYKIDEGGFSMGEPTEKKTGVFDKIMSALPMLGAMGGGAMGGGIGLGAGLLGKGIKKLIKR